MAAKNFLCFGQEGVQVYFENYENIVLVKGINLDTGTEIDPASNGTGKSSLQDIVSYCLYGKTVKKPKQLKSENLNIQTSEFKKQELGIYGYYF